MVVWESPYLCSCDSGSNHAALILQPLKTARITLNVIGCELWWLTRRGEESSAARAKILTSDGLAFELSQMKPWKLADDRGSLASLGDEHRRNGNQFFIPYMR